jgi:hypothetical protein
VNVYFNAVAEPDSAIAEDMPLNETDKAWVREHVRNVLQRHSWGKLTGFIKDWSGLGAVVAVVLFVALQWSGYTEFKTHTGDTLIDIGNHLDKIDSDLLEIKASQSPLSALHELNGLTQRKFAKSLPALLAASQRPLLNQKISQPLLEGIAQKLQATNPASPDYWPAVLQFLQFATAGLAPPGVPAPGVGLMLISNGRTLTGTGFRGVTVKLDGGEVRNAIFDHCRVIFTDNPVKMSNVQFINSVFEFPISSAPSPYIQQASKLLLASNLKSSSISKL